MISISTLNDSFHSFCEQLIGINTAATLQNCKRPKSKYAYLLAYFKLFNDCGNTSKIDELSNLFGMMHFGMLCAGPEFDIIDVMGFPHNLRCLQSKENRGILSVIFTGDGEQWSLALKHSTDYNNSVKEWGKVCYSQFAKYDLDNFIHDTVFGNVKFLK